MTLAAVGQLMILVGAAAVAGYQAWEARRLRKEQARPFVVVDFEPERPPVMNLVITNLGKTMARNVRIDADPPFQSSQDESHPESLAQLKIFADGIPALAPGKRIVLLFDLLDRRPKELPNSYWVTVRYEWDEGDPITEKLRLDLDLYNNLAAIRRYGIHDCQRRPKTDPLATGEN